MPVVGNLHELDAEAMVRVRPTHVFVQRASVDVDPLLRDLADAHGWDVVAGPLVDFSDVRRFLEAIPEVTGRDGEVAHRCRSRIDAVDEALRPRGALDMRVLLVSGGPEPLAWGAGTYLGQLLAAAGGQNLVEGRVWRTLSLEDVARLDADLILLVGIDEEPPHWAHDRVERLAFEGLEFPGPHLVTVTDRLREMIQQVAGSR